MDINYKVHGQGEPVIFIHGNSSSLQTWNQFHYHTMNAKCYFVDLPGHGDSDWSEDINQRTYTISWFAECLKSFCDAHEIKNPVIIGHSLGAFIGLELSKLMEFKGLIMLGAFPCNLAEDFNKYSSQNEHSFLYFQKNVERAQFVKLAQLCFEDLRLINQFSRDWDATDSRIREEILKSLAVEPYYMDYINSLDEKAVVLIGEKDPFFNHYEVKKNDLVTYIPDAGHFFHWDSPMAVGILFHLIQTYLDPRSRVQKSRDLRL